MIDRDLTLPYQRKIGLNALLGDIPSQRKVLEMAVRLSDAGVDPMPEFKSAVLYALRMALERDQLPPKNKRGGQRLGNESRNFRIAMSYWKDVFLNGEAGANKRTMAEWRCSSAAMVSKQVKFYGDMAKVAALRDLAFGDSSLNPHWFNQWQDMVYEIEHRALQAAFGK